MIRVCVSCDHEFETNRSNKKYCSDTCKTKFRRDNELDHEERICKCCDQIFRINKYQRTVYCSLDCMGKDRRVPKQEGYIIYFIKNKTNNKGYVGSTKNFKIRIIQHKSDLKLNRHKNSRLQSDHNLYGYKSFEFIIVEKGIDPEERYEREQHYITLYDLCDPQKGYNIASDAKAVMKNRKHSAESIERMRISHKNMSDETRLNISKGQKGKKRSPEAVEKSAAARRGIPLSEETKEKLSKAQSGSKSVHSKLSHENVLDIKKRLANKGKQKDIAKIYNIDQSTISNIANNKSYKGDLL